MQIFIILTICVSSIFLFFMVIKENKELDSLRKENEELKIKKQQKLDEINDNINYIKRLNKK